MKPDKCKDDQVYLSVVDRGGYSIKDYLAEMSGSIPICISENVCSMEVLEMYLQEVLKDKHDLTIFAREENYFHQCMQMDLSLFQKNWEMLCKALIKTYQVDNSFLSYFSMKLEAKDKYAQGELLLWWKKRLARKQLAYWIALLDYYRNRFQKLIYTAMKQEHKSSIDKSLWWSIDKGIWRKLDISIYLKYQLLFERNNSLQTLADSLGRRKGEKQKENKLEYKHKMTDTNAKVDIEGICEGNDLSSVLCHEFALLHRDIDSLFYKKYTSRQLEQWSWTRESSLKKREGMASWKEKGPVIICIDTSGSMVGGPEFVAKAACYGIVYTALREKREVLIIAFSINIKCIELIDWEKDKHKIENFLSHSFYGGTRMDSALRQTMDLLGMNCYKQADVLLISDFVIPKLPSVFVKDIKQYQEQKTVFHSLQIGDHVNCDIMRLMNEKWKYDKDGGNIINIG